MERAALVGRLARGARTAGLCGDGVLWLCEPCAAVKDVVTP